MSYLVFARKWRPLTFDDVVGQQHITDTLKRAIEKNRVAHAYVFSGTRGVGKTTTARILARALNCDTGPTTEPCGSCESCKAIINGSSFDVLEIDGASNSGVDDIRELRENISYTSMGGKYRIFIIDEVHMLSKSAFNALLKTLEEPPKNVIFIFATTEPQKIPETIHSRCQRYDFRRIASEQIVGQIEKICTHENITFEKSGIELIARRADGSMRDALSLLDQVCSFCQENITEKEVRSVLGIVETELYNDVLEAIAEKSALPVLHAVEDILNRGFDLLE
ncbi:MAG: DNA polymerase III subunit gamma/tau, partial [bacterium]|nr:DNA polymerase III subunit gamma/tau [bacterium]